MSVASVCAGSRIEPRPGEVSEVVDAACCPFLAQTRPSGEDANRGRNARVRAPYMARGGN